ncbi:MAG TPA: response regulator transcription factor [Thermoanaerobaculia bacterium]|nr:response regulator transcription factor [Thermoanaerobaculia bacterium]
MSRLLLVDDDPHIRKLLTIYLRSMPWEIVEAATGEEAMAAIEEGSFDVVLLDLILPQHGGFRICQRIRQRNGSEPWVIVMTADDSPETREMAMECGANDFVGKPFAPEMLVEKLRELRKV